MAMNFLRSAVLVLVAPLAILVVPACGDDHGHDDSTSGAHDSPYADCKAIIDACHLYDIGEGAVHDCHDLAHDAKSEADCTPKKEECFQTCRAAGAATDAGTGG